MPDEDIPPPPLVGPFAFGIRQVDGNIIWAIAADIPRLDVKKAIVGPFGLQGVAADYFKDMVDTARAVWPKGMGELQLTEEGGAKFELFRQEPLIGGNRVARVTLFRMEDKDRTVARLREVAAKKAAT